MKKKILLGLLAVAVVAGGVAGLAAYEAHIINVTAKIENALSVSPDEIAFGTVFPQEHLERPLTIALSSSFLVEDRVDDVHYVIKQKPKVRPNEQYNPDGDPYAIISPAGYGQDVVAHVYCLDEGLALTPKRAADLSDVYYQYCYPILCGQLSKTPDLAPANDSEPVPSPHDWKDANIQAWGNLVKSDQDIEDTWIIDLTVPGFQGMVDQVYTEEVYGYLLPAELEHQTFGCDLWIEVDSISLTDRPNPTPMHISLENKTDQWEIISNDQTWGDIDYFSNVTSFNGVITGQGLSPNAPYQITLNGPGTCTFTDDGLAGVGPDAFSSGYWNNNTNLEPTCGAPGEGVYNMDLVSNWYTVWTDGNGDFTHNFDFALPVGNYSGVKVLVKKMLNPFVTPWADTGAGYPSFNLYETQAIDFIIVP